MTRRNRTALLGLGSNIEPERHMPRALDLLASRFEVVCVSPAYRSAAVGGTGRQPDFVNRAVKIRTDLGPRALREAGRRIEDACGRRRTGDRYAPRPMDVDIGLLDDLVVDLDAWQLPDPQLHDTPFVLVPAAAVWPDAVHPVLGRTLADLCDALPPAERARLVRID